MLTYQHLRRGSVSRLKYCSATPIGDAIHSLKSVRLNYGTGIYSLFISFYFDWTTIAGGLPRTEDALRLYFYLFELRKTE